MNDENTKLSANDAWIKILKKYDILNKLKKNGYFNIKSSQIKEFREPRLMAKWDSSETLPKILIDNKINILPTSRSSYILSDFILYKEFPESSRSLNEFKMIELPELESINIENINSESNAINILLLSNALSDFLESDENYCTFNGRMGTGIFDFKVDSFSGVKREVHVENAQCEIDGGFENSSSIVIMEAKNVVYEDFHIRQLYYPYRLWKEKVNKPIRLIYSVYSNKIYRILEYRFLDVNDYSSIELVKEKCYSLEDTSITFNELNQIKQETAVVTNDNMDNTDIPFIQADRFDRIISLLEHLYNNPMSSQEIAELMEFELRQSDYYYNAGKYLGLFDKIKDEDNNILIILTDLGNKLFKMGYKKRQLTFVELMLQHQIFADCFDFISLNGKVPTITFVKEKMLKNNVCGEGQIGRRASSVLGWCKWIINLISD
ncbi:type II restriction enzyme [Anaerorhabdus sp.]|uniref:type II restriction enzyme n=1 Tax=Anaerorhabdus sp. TaxID=1872524 RepID=UPI002FC8D87A